VREASGGSWHWGVPRWGNLSAEFALPDGPLGRFVAIAWDQVDFHRAGFPGSTNRRA